MADHDIIVLGAGVAGLSAAMAAASHGADVLVIDRLGAGGQVVNIEHIANMPGFPDGVSGIELGPALQEQAEAAGAEFALDEIGSVAREGADWILTGAEGTYTARALIWCAGSTLAPLGVPDEKRFVGRGLSTCASCDGPLFRGEHVLVAGGGDSAVQEALALVDHADRVTLVHTGQALTAQRILADRLAESPVDVWPVARITAIAGEAGMTGATVERDGTPEDVEAAGVFAFVGLRPASDLLDGIVDRDADGRIVVDAVMATSAPALWAAGDVRSRSICWLASAAGDGATAGVSAAMSIAHR